MSNNNQLANAIIKALGKKYYIAGQFINIFLAVLLFAHATALNAQEQVLHNNIIIEAQKHIEWIPDEHRYVAIGSASVKSDGWTLLAEEITAYNFTEEEKKKNKTKRKLKRMDARLDVELITGKTTAKSNRATYSALEGKFVLAGGDLRIIGEEGIIRAKKRIVYWTQKDLMVAHGNAHINIGENSLASEEIIGVFEKLPESKKSQRSLKELHIRTPLKIETTEQTVVADRGIYDTKSRIVIVCGNVVITRSTGVSKGHCAEMNMVNGRSKMSSDTKQVQGVIEKP